VLLLAAILASASSQQARASVHMIKAQRVTREEWERSRRRREIVIIEGGRQVTVRLIEFE
jgi:hypothetical protein